MDLIWGIIVLMIIIWIAGLLLKIGGKFIHILVVGALVLFLLNLLGIV